MNPREQRAAHIQRMRQIVEGAEAAERDLTGEERQEFDRLDGEVRELEQSIRRTDRLAELRREGGFYESDEERAAEVERDRERIAAAGGNPDESRGLDGVVGVEERGVPASLNEFRARRAGQPVQDEDEYRQAFYALMSTPDLRSLGADELRALSKATAAAGANLVPTTFERRLLEKARDFGVMRELATIITTTAGEELKIPAESGHGVASWIAESAAYSESDESFAQVVFNAYKAGTIMKVSEELLTDAAFDLEAYIERQYALRIGILQNAAYVAGDGAGKPTGLVTSAPSAFTAASGTTVTADELVRLTHEVIRPYRRGAVFLVNDSTVLEFRLLKDADGNYLWRPGLTEGAPDTILGHRVEADPDMPATAINNKAVLFGDISAYVIRDVRGVAFQRLNELYAGNGQVGFRAYHRTDGKLVNTDAVKAITMAAV